jgi:hypothetical protein
MRYVRTILTLILFICSSIISSSQTSFTPRYFGHYSPKTLTILYKLGETIVPIRVMQYGEAKDRVYINLHADEITSIMAAKNLLEKEGGLFIRIDNNNKRNIRFRLRGRYYAFDPNRMFSRAGIVQTLSALSRTNELAIGEIEKFAARILELIPDNPSCIIALHNNTDGKFGINSYLPGAERENDARKVHADPSQDDDDIFLTTDRSLYDRLSSEKFNTILQDNDKARKDGSLSIYCGEKSISYLNCETEHGKTEQYSTMLSMATEHILRMNTYTSYSYAQVPGQSGPVAGQPVYFGERKIGEVRSVSSDSTQGSLDIEKKFRIYSNMDLFYIQKDDGSSGIELRIDPTRGKEPVDPNRTTLQIISPK